MWKRRVPDIHFFSHEIDRSVSIGLSGTERTISNNATFKEDKAALKVNDQDFQMTYFGKLIVTVKIKDDALDIQWPDSEWREWKELQDSQELKNLLDSLSSLLEQRSVAAWLDLSTVA